MNVHVVRLPIVVLALSLAMASSFASRPVADDGPPGAGRPDPEVERIRTHLLAVERELLAADVSGLTPAQREARAVHVRRLREYREQGVFPHNHVVPGRRVPVFVDEHGTHCAVGYLIARSGGTRLVQRIASTRNLATVPELADDPELVAWLADAGLSVDEAARIQPWYGYDPPAAQTDRRYGAATLVGAGLGGAAVVWNLAASRPDDAGTLPGIVGVGVGAAEMLLAGAGLALESHEANRTHVGINLGVGVLSTIAGLRTLLAQVPVPRVMGSRTGPGGVRWGVAPWAAPGEGGAGMRVTVRF